ncbi:DNA polymerase III subunit beta [Helicobacter felis]|uniref:DNA polymerase III subunit beta n=1 Tax=Helicobacter felis TaxID=214 RepID=UPI0018F82E3C|nr:DNA polymerase III subunit beta [Helicobacter felis]
MKFIIAKTELEAALKDLIAFTNKKDMVNITSHVCIEAKADALIFQANDLEMGLCLTLNIPAQETGSAVLNAKYLLDIISKLEKGDLLLESQDNFMHVHFKRSKFKLPLLDKEYFPSFPTYDHLPVVYFDDSTLSDYFKKLAQVITTNASKYEFSGVLLALQENLELVATDTKRLSVVQMEIGGTTSADRQELILPKRAMLEVAKLFRGDFEMRYDKNMIFFKNASMVLFAKLISGKYPHYQNIIPSTFAHQLECNTQDFKDAINITQALGATTKIIFRPDKIEFETLQTENPSFASTFVEASTPLDGFVIHAQARHLLDALSALSTPTFDFCLSVENQPFVIQKNGFITVVMPVAV